MTDISVTTVGYQVEKRSWLLSKHGTEDTPSVTLDVSAFTAGTHYPNGYFPSGLAVGVITAASDAKKTVVGPYDDTATDGRQTCAGILFSSVKVPNPADTTKDVGGAILVHGFVDPAKLPLQTGAGSLDANGKADLKLIHFSAGA